MKLDEPYLMSNAEYIATRTLLAALIVGVSRQFQTMPNGPENFVSTLASTAAAAIESGTFDDGSGEIASPEIKAKAVQKLSELLALTPYWRQETGPS